MCIFLIVSKSDKKLTKLPSLSPITKIICSSAANKGLRKVLNLQVQLALRRAGEVVLWTIFTHAVIQPVLELGPYQPAPVQPSDLGCLGKEAYC